VRLSFEFRLLLLFGKSKPKTFQIGIILQIRRPELDSALMILILLILRNLKSISPKLLRKLVPRSTEAEAGSHGRSPMLFPILLSP